MTIDLAIAAPVAQPVLAADSGPLLESKFALPEPPRFMVSRTRLVERVAQCVRGPVTVVTGPAGSGKTQLVAAWAGTQTADHVAWITLEDEDSRPSVFWTYVVEALRRAGLPLSSGIGRSPPNAAIDRSSLVRLAASLSDQADTVILVLDGVSSLAGQQWATDLDFVLRHANHRLRLVLVGRWDPPLPLHRYRLAGRLGEIRSEDLAFTAEETEELLAFHGVTLSAPALASLHEHTEGWAAGLRLSAMALVGRDDAESLVATITGDEANIAEYFVGEVLRAQPPGVREFLLDTSILDAFTPELAEVLSGRSDARRMLAELERENAFVRPVDERSSAYRYHRLFAELLRAQLASEDPDRVRRLHRLAADWFGAHGQVVDAVRHAVTARDWETAAAIAVGDYAVGELVVGGTADRLGAMFRDMPPDVDSAEATMVAAALALADGDPDRCAHYLGRAEELILGGAGGYTNAHMLSGVVLEVLLAAAYREAPRVLRSVRVAEFLMKKTPADRLAAHPELGVLMLAAKGTAQSWLGAIAAAAVTLTEAVTTASVGCEYPKIACLQELALIEAYRGRLRHAETLAGQAIDLAERRVLPPAFKPVGAKVALAWVAVEHYDVEAAWRHLRAADPLGVQGTDELVSSAFAVVKSRLLRSRGELRGALQTLGEVDPEAPGHTRPAWLAREITLSQARLMIISGRADEAMGIIRRFPEPRTADVAVVHAAALAAAGEAEQARQMATPVADAAGAPSPVAVEAWLVLATLAVDTGDVGQARAALRQALQLATPESQWRAFHQVGVRLRRLLRDDKALAEQVRLEGASPRPIRPPASAVPADPPAPVIVDALSNREMEVLRQMAAMLPTEEIAASLYVSVNTVKTHVRSILRKLAASRRNEAVRRARQLGLI